MLIRYKTNKLRAICEDADKATRAYGIQMAGKIHQRVDELSSADSIEMLLKYRIGRCHALDGNRKGQYAMDLAGAYRLVFTQIDSQTITVQILEIVDYH